MLYLPGRSEKGQSLTEYGLILVLISVVVVAILALFGDQVNTVFQEVSNAMNATS